jgi:acetylornithine deacetylase/succinyl-diaminopimelate desuccinylase-like protein
MRLTAIDRLAAEPRMIAYRARLTEMLSRVIDEAIVIQQIPAPTFHEGQRAAYIRSRFAGLDAVEVDALHNVYGCLRGVESTLPALLVAAHTDTVFESDIPLTIHRNGSRIYGPGLGDNSLGVAALLAMVDVLHDQPLPADVWFVANSREEGLGDLGGMRAVYARLSAQLGAALIVEGIAFGRIYHAGIAVRRLKITCQTAGGHSWLHFGRPSAIHSLVQVAAQIAALQPPESPRTTYNIGMIEGGRSVNSIAPEASMFLDLRSEDPTTLAAIENQIMELIDTARSPDVEFAVEVVGDRPAGAIPVSHPLVQMARAALESMGVRPLYEAGSTDANVLLASGLPTITIGITHGGNAHREDEFIETANILDGLWQLLLLMVGTARGLKSF